MECRKSVSGIEFTNIRVDKLQLEETVHVCHQFRDDGT